MTTKNVYQKLQEVRVALQGKNLKKSGKNQNISYYELSDFLPTLNILNNDIGLTTRFFIKEGTAILEIINCEKPEEVAKFTSPTVEVTLPRGQDIQGLGAKITYMRRYLLMIAFEIVESDYVDKQNQATEKELPEKYVTKLYACKSLVELGEVAKKIQLETKKKYQKGLLEAYTLKKAELSEVKEVIQK